MGHVPDSQVKQSRLLPALLGQSRHLEPQILQAPVESVKEEYIRFDMCLHPVLLQAVFTAACSEMNVALGL